MTWEILLTQRINSSGIPGLRDAMGTFTAVFRNADTRRLSTNRPVWLTLGEWSGLAYIECAWMARSVCNGEFRTAGAWMWSRGK
jgi:hypothetical protein